MFFREREREGERKGEKLRCERNTNWLPLEHAPTGEQTCDPGMSPDWGLNRQPSALQDDAQVSHADQGEVTFLLYPRQLIPIYSGIHFPFSVGAFRKEISQEKQ